MELTFETVDVFTDRQFGGNPLAVVLDAQNLSSEQMQAIAAEFNLAETTFVLPPQSADHTAQVRIFTPRAEMPFAGHPNVAAENTLESAVVGVAGSPSTPVPPAQGHVIEKVERVGSRGARRICSAGHANLHHRAFQCGCRR